MAGLRDVLDPTQPRKLSPILRGIYEAPVLAEPIQQVALENTGDFGRGLRSAATGAVGSVQRYVGANEAARENQLEAQQWAPEIQTTDQVDGFGTGIRYVAGKLGEAAGSIPIALAGGVGGRLLAGTKGAYLGATAAYQPVMAGGHMQDLDANPNTAGMSETDKRIRATGIGAAQAVVEGAGPAWAINRFAKPTALLKPGFGEAVKRAGGVLATDAALEGAGAAASDVMGQGSIMQLDPTTRYNPRQTFEAGVGEAVGGAGMGTVHAPLTVAHDYMDAGARGAADLAVRGAKASPGVIEDALSAGKAGVDAATKGFENPFRTSADFRAKHPEMDGLVNPPPIPDSFTTAPQAAQVAFMDNYEATQNTAARTVAQRILADEYASNADKHAAQSMLESSDPQAWETFSKGVVFRQKKDQTAASLGQAASVMRKQFEALQGKIKGKLDDLGAKADLAGIKHNLERTQQDIDFEAAMAPTLKTVHALGGEADVAGPTIDILKRFVLSRYGKDAQPDGFADIPDALIRVYGDSTPGLAAKAFDSLRRLGMTPGYESNAVENLTAEVAQAVKLRTSHYKAVEDVIRDNLVPSKLDTMRDDTVPDLADMISRYLDKGGRDERVEGVLDEHFGVHKDMILEKIDALRGDHSPGVARYGVDKAATEYGDEGFGNDKAVDENPFESPTTEVEAGVNYHMGDGGRAFDKTSPYYADNVQRAQGKLTDGSQATTYDAKAGGDVVRHDMISVGQHARDSGDNTVMNDLMDEHGLNEKQVNERFQVMRTRDKMPDEAEPVEVRAPELAEPVSKNGKNNPRSWGDVTSTRKMVNGKAVTTDTSTIAHGRIFLSKKSSDLVKSAGDETLPKQFVTSAQKLIGKMLERKTAGAFDERTAEMTGPQQKLALFAVGLTSLLNSGKFHDEVHIKMPDGAMKAVDLSHLAKIPKPEEVRNGMSRDERAAVEKRNIDAWRAAVERNSAELKSSLKSLPDDFVLYQGKDFKVTMKDALGTTDKATRAEKQKKVWKDKETGKEVAPKSPNEKFEVSDIPTMTRDELRAEYAATKKSLGSVEKQRAKLAEDSPEREKLAGIRDGLQAKLDAFEEAGKEIVYTGKTDKNGDRILAKFKEGDRTPAPEGSATRRREQRAGIDVGTEKKETAGDVGPRTEGGGRTEHHGIGESEEMAASAQKEHGNEVRDFDEATGEVKHNIQTLRATSEARKDTGRAERHAVQDALPKSRAQEAGARVGPVGRTDQGSAQDLHSNPGGLTLATLLGRAGGFRIVEGLKVQLNKDGAVAEITWGNMPYTSKRFIDKFGSDILLAAQRAAQAKALGESPKLTDIQVVMRLGKSDGMAGAVGVKHNMESTGEEPTSASTKEGQAALREELTHLLGKDVSLLFREKGVLSGSAEWTNNPETQVSLIEIAVNALDPMSKLYHESMHEFFQRALDDKNLGGIHETLRKAASSELVLRQMQRHFAAEPEVKAQLESDPTERVAYMFQLWAAGKLHVGPQTETVFRKLINMVKKVLGMMTSDQKALEIMEQFASGNMSDRGAMARVLNTQEARGAYLRKVGAVMKPVVERGAEIVGFAENILADSGNPALIRVGKQFNNKTGSQGDKQGLLSAEAQAQNKYMNEFAKALRHGDKEDVRLAMEGLQKKEDHADPIVRKIQDDVKAVFKRMYTYMADAGVMRWDEKAGDKGEWVPVGKIDDYRLPVSWDASKIIAHSEKFKALLFEHHAKELDAIAKTANKEVADRQGAGQYTASQEKLANPDGVALTADNIADALIKRLISTNGQVELKESSNALGFSPFMKSVNERSLDWINQSVFHEFQEKDMAKILSTYVGQATKRAEYSRRFGPDGGKLQDEMNTAWEHEIDKIMKEKYKVDGAVATAKVANATEWEAALGKLAEGVDSKAVTTQAAKRLEPARRAVMAMEGTLGHDISPLARKVNAYSIVYQNMRLLGYSMFSNLIDPLGIVVRGGEFKDAYATFKRGMRDVGREWGTLTGLREAKASDRDEAVKVAEMIGTVDSAAFMSTMGNMYGSQYLGKWAREANDNFFRWNGMEAFNKAMRVGATQAAISFIKRHYEAPNKHTERYFKELNLDPKDIKIGEDGRLNVESPAVQQAVMRWVDGAQLRPNAAMRPTMASDPHYASFYHLKQFMYAMQAVILKRVQVEIKNGNTDPLMLMFAGYVPMMLAADAAKGLLQVATGGGAPIWEHEGVAGVVSHGVQRAGLLGVAQMGVDVASYGPLGLGGPTVEQVGSAVVDPLGKTVAEAVAVGPTNMLLRGTNWDN